MAWNEPGGGGNRDPWGGRGGEQGPPDLDEVIRKFQQRLGGLFGGKRGGGRGGTTGGGRIGIGLILIAALVVWLLSGIYIIDEGKRGVVLRFGKFTQITMPGPHWHIPYPIEQVQVVDVGQRRFVEVGYRSTGGRGGSPVPVPREALMLTQDENIVNVQIAVQYQVKDARDYLFNVRDPDLTLKQVTESAIREVIGKSKMDFVLTEGRSEVVLETKELMQAVLDDYETGLLVTSVNLQDAQPPEEVQDAFHDAIKAREDEARQKNEAEAYANDILPKARGKAARKIEEANAYKQRVVAQAEGEASRFEQLLKEYKKAPEVTRKRLYLETMEKVLTDTSKVTVDLSQGSSLLYLPLDRMFEQRGGQPVRQMPGFDLPTGEAAPAQSSSGSGRSSRRLREAR